MAPRFDLLKRYGGAAKLREAAQHSPALREEIQAELDGIKGVNPDRCVVTKEYRDALQASLG